MKFPLKPANTEMATSDPRGLAVQVRSSASRALRIDLLGLCSLLTVSLLGTSFHVTAATAQERLGVQSSAQRSCIRGIGKGADELTKAQARLIRKCVKMGGMGRLGTGEDGIDGPPVQACIEQDLRGARSKAQQSARDKELVSCSAEHRPFVAVPSLSRIYDPAALQLEEPLALPAESEQVKVFSQVDNELGALHQTSLLEDLFGTEVDAALFYADFMPGVPISKIDKDTAKCQQAVLGALQKREAIERKQFARCLKSALRDDEDPIQVSGDRSLESQCLMVGRVTTTQQPSKHGHPEPKALMPRSWADPDRGKIVILSALMKKCAGEGVDILGSDGAFPGVCSSSAGLSELASCLDRTASCRVCQYLNQSHGMQGDCDLFDDGGVNGTCQSRLPVCGDGVLDPSVEECDDGNTRDGDCCDASCRLADEGSVCGNQTDMECSAPDTCDAMGVCQPNHDPAGSECTNGSCGGNGVCEIEDGPPVGTDCSVAPIIIADYWEYQTPEGFNSDRPRDYPGPDGNRTQNSALYTAQYVRALVRHLGDVPTGEANRLRSILPTLEVEPGLTRKDPTNHGDYDSNDNILALIYMDSVLNTGFAQRWLNYGRNQTATSFDTETPGDDRNLLAEEALYWTLRARHPFGIPWVYNNVRPRKFAASAWKFRHLATLAQAKLVAGESLDFDERVALTWELQNEKDDQDGWKLSWLLMLTSERADDSWLGEKDRWAWRDNFWNSKYNPGGMGRLLADYYGSPRGEQHPDFRWLYGDMGQAPGEATQRQCPHISTPLKRGKYAFDCRDFASGIDAHLDLQLDAGGGHLATCDPFSYEGVFDINDDNRNLEVRGYYKWDQNRTCCYDRAWEIFEARGDRYRKLVLQAEEPHANTVHVNVTGISDAAARHCEKSTKIELDASYRNGGWDTRWCLKCDDMSDQTTQNITIWNANDSHILTCGPGGMKYQTLDIGTGGLDVRLAGAWKDSKNRWNCYEQLPQYDQNGQHNKERRMKANQGSDGSIIGDAPNIKFWLPNRGEMPNGQCPSNW